MIRQEMNERVYKIKQLLGELKWLLMDQKVKVVSSYNGQPYGRSRPVLTGKEFRISNVSFGNGELFIWIEGERVSLRPTEIEFLYDTGEREPPHQTGCICADCSGAELTADND